MKRILITGMTSPQASSGLGDRNTTLAKLMTQSIETRNHAVTWKPADLVTDPRQLDGYDAVVIGVAPVTSLSANYSYGALTTMYHLLDDPRLTLFIDAPDPGQIRTSLQSVVSNPDGLFKPFYRARRDYGAVSGSAELQTYVWGACRALLQEAWPTTLYPELPWNNSEAWLQKSLPEGATGSVRAINLDSLILTSPGPKEAPTGDRWLVDAYQTKWSQSVMSGLTTQVLPVKWHKGWTDAQILGQMSLAKGVLISPQKPGGTWWSQYYAMALSCGVPVATYWQDSERLGAPWTELAASIELRSDAERRALADSQRALYENSIPTTEHAAASLARLVGVETGERQSVK